MSIATKSFTEEQRREAARAMGSARTERKAASSRQNGFKPGHSFSPGKEPVPLAEIECGIKAGKQAGSPCSGGDSLTGHHWSCPRGQAIKRRQKEGRDVRTGQKLGEAGPRG